MKISLRQGALKLKKLKEKCDIPIFHDDQHGTAVVTLAGLINALKVTGKQKECQNSDQWSRSRCHCNHKAVAFRRL